MGPLSIWCLFLDSFTASDLKLVHAAAPSVQIPAQLSHGIEYSEKKLLRH